MWFRSVRSMRLSLNEEIILSVDLNRGEFEIGQFSLSIYYDPNVLTLTNAGLGVLFEACNWEYFNYTVQPCDGCDYNLIKIEAQSEYYDNGQEATCHTGPGTLASLVFQTTTDSAAACTGSPVGFYWKIVMTTCLSILTWTPCGSPIMWSI